MFSRKIWGGKIYSDGFDTLNRRISIYAVKNTETF